MYNMNCSHYNISTILRHYLPKRYTCCDTLMLTNVLYKILKCNINLFHTYLNNNHHQRMLKIVNTPVQLLYYGTADVNYYWSAEHNRTVAGSKSTGPSKMMKIK